MSFEGIALATLFLGLLGLPLLPGLRELLRPRDDQALAIDQGYTRNPRHFGLEFRRRLAPHIGGVSVPGAEEAPAEMEPAPTIVTDLRLGDGAQQPGLTVDLGSAEIGAGARLGRLYVRGDARLGAEAHVAEIACDGSLTLGPNCRVDGWADAEGDATAGPGCDLGRSATAGGALHLGAGCRFRRAWGLPVVTAARERVPESDMGAAEAVDRSTIEDAVVWSRHRLSLPAALVLERDLVVYGDLYIGRGCRVRGSIKAYGDVIVGRDAQISGTVIGRKRIRLLGGVQVNGNLFAEGDIALGPGTRVGGPGGFNTVYSAGRVRVGPDVAVYGWILAERSGRVD